MTTPGHSHKKRSIEYQDFHSEYHNNEKQTQPLDQKPLKQIHHGDSESKNKRRRHEESKLEKKITKKLEGMNFKTPFTKRVMEYSAPLGTEFPTIKTYDGTTDPDDHIHVLFWSMKAYNLDERLWCTFFPTTITENAWYWFRSLPVGLIDNFSELVGKLQMSFITQRKFWRDSRDDDVNTLLISPFTRRINEYSVTQEGELPTMRIYDGTTDPDNHTHHFYWTMMPLRLDERFWCIFFATTLTKYARHWFSTLPAGSIDNYFQLSDSFQARFDRQRKFK